MVTNLSLNVLDGKQLCWDVDEGKKYPWGFDTTQSRKNEVEEL